MTLEQLFQTRYTRYIKSLLKYACHIVNDHFVLVFFLLIGVGGYTYAQFLETVTPGAVLPRVLVLVFFFIWTGTGSIALLVEPADRVFLLPKEREFQKLLKRLAARSFGVQMLLAVPLIFVAFPVFVATLSAQPIDGLFIFLALLSLKWLHLLEKMASFFHRGQEKSYRLRMLSVGGRLLGLISLLFLNVPITALVLAALALFGAFQFFKGHLYSDHLLNWEALIETEERRLEKIYRFIQLFTDVPAKQNKIRRLAWLDQPLRWLSKHTPNAPYYYLLRTVTRNTEYSLLILRVTLVGMFLLVATASFPLSLLLSVLFLYMVGFQLLPLLNELNSLPQFQIYPVAEKVKVEAVFRLIFQLLSLVSFFFALAATAQHGLRGGWVLLTGLFFTAFFSFFYAPRRLRQAKNKKEHSVS